MLKQGSQFSRPENLGTRRSLQGLLTYGIPIKLIQTNFNVNAGLTYNGTPSVLNYARNTGNSSAARFSPRLCPPGRARRCVHGSSAATTARPARPRALR